MKRSLKLLMVLGIVLGPIFWSGCVEQPQTGLKRVPIAEPPDLTKWSPDTHPELRVGMDPLGGYTIVTPLARSN